MRVYIDNGAHRPFNVRIPTPRSPNTVAVRNNGQIEFPLLPNIFARGAHTPTR